MINTKTFHDWVRQEVPEAQRADAANSLVYEANVRLTDPVYGCMGAISALQQQVQALQAELDAVRAEILKHKYSSETPNINISSQLALLTSGAISIAAPPPPPPSLPPPPPPPPPPHPLPTTSSPSSLYTQPSSATDYSPISSENISFFG